VDLQVQDRDIAFPDLPVHWPDLGQALTQLIQATLEHLIIDDGVGPFHVQSIQIRQPHLGHHAYPSREASRTSPLKLLNLDAGTIDGIDPMITQRLADDPWDEDLDHLVTDHGRAQPSLDQRPWGLAGSEPTDADALSEPIQRPLESTVDLILGDLDGQANLTSRQRLGYH
jgi:hypothetical protein